MRNFKIREKVVCVDSDLKYNDTLSMQPHKIIKGEIYTIDYIDSVGGLGLIEIFSGIYHDGEKAGFKPSRFRKLDHSFGEKICAEILQSVKVKQEQLN